MHVCVAVILGKREELLATDKQFELAEVSWRVILGFTEKCMCMYIYRYTYVFVGSFMCIYAKYELQYTYIIYLCLYKCLYICISTRTNILVFVIGLVYNNIGQKPCYNCPKLFAGSCGMISWSIISRLGILLTVPACAHAWLLRSSCWVDGPTTLEKSLKPCQLLEMSGSNSGEAQRTAQGRVQGALSGQLRTTAYGLGWMPFSMLAC